MNGCEGGPSVLTQDFFLGVIREQNVTPRVWSWTQMQLQTI